MKKIENYEIKINNILLNQIKDKNKAKTECLNMDTGKLVYIASNLSYEKCKTEEEKNIVTNVFLELTDYRNPYVKKSLMSNKETPIEAWESLILKDDETKIEVASSLKYENFTEKDYSRVANIFNDFLADKNPDTKIALTKRLDSLPINIIQELAFSEFYAVRNNLVKNLNYNCCKSKQDEEKITDIFKRFINFDNHKDYGLLVSAEANPNIEKAYNFMLADLSKTNFEQITGMDIENLKKLTNSTEYESLSFFEAFETLNDILENIKSQGIKIEKTTKETQIDLINNSNTNLNKIIKNLTEDDIKNPEIVNSLINRLNNYEISEFFELDKVKDYPELFIGCLKLIDFNEEKIVNDKKINIEKQ